MRFTRTARAAAIAAVAFGVAVASAVPAGADTGFVPDNDDIVVVGSDTTQKVWVDLANLYNGRTPAPARRLASFDATGASPITIRNDNPGTAGVDPVQIVRPNGSGAGIKELATPTSAAGATPVDIARSSRGRATGDSASVGFVRFAQDNLRWMANSGVTGVTSLTDAQLTGIYNCTITNWSALGGPNLAIVPLIPQSQSGTRAAWAQRVGINPASLPACVTDQNGTVQEHDAAPVRNTAGSIAPVSLGRYNLLSAAEKANTFLGTIPSPDDAEYNRDLFQVVRLAAGEVANAGVADIVGDGFGFSSTGGTPYVCEPADAGTPRGLEAAEVIEDNGFTPLAEGVCGTFE